MDDVSVTSSPVNNSERDAADAGPSSGTAGDASAPVIKRRAPIACRRCRRMRSKCVHDKAQPPCRACQDAGLGADDCIFPVRGQPDNDRDFRHPRMRAEKTTRRDPAKARREILDAPAASLAAQRVATKWETLPPLPDIVELVRRFAQCHYQLSFIPKQQFSQRLLQNHRSVSVFLVLSILSISARSTPALTARYGTAFKASEFFMERAIGMAYGEIYEEPTLERCQAFFLLSLAQQGRRFKNQRSINMSIAMRMATSMRLHREDTYCLPNPTPDLVTMAESARRTMWMLQSQEQIPSGNSSPISLSPSDITALLPCHETEFNLGQAPTIRAALMHTPPAIENPALTVHQGRSLYATLIQAYQFWGAIGRRAVSVTATPRPWEPNSRFSAMIHELQSWEGSLPSDHRWGDFLLKSHQAEGQDLAYLEVAMIPRLCHIFLRQPYLSDIIKNMDAKEEKQQAFFSSLSLELFQNVRQLYDIINSHFLGKPAAENVGAYMTAFCVFNCGLFAGYLCKHPDVCPDPMITRDGPMILQHILSILLQYQEFWPLAADWVKAIRNITSKEGSNSSSSSSRMTVPTEGAMSDNREHLSQPAFKASTASPSPSPSMYNSRSQASGSVPPIPQDMVSAVHANLPNRRLLYPQQQQQQQHQQPIHYEHQQLISPTQQLSDLYMAPGNPARATNMGRPLSIDTMGMSLEEFQAAQHLHAGPSSAAYVAGISQPQAHPEDPVIYNQLGPMTDGFDSELQSYTRGPQSWAQGSHNSVFDGYDMN